MQNCEAIVVVQQTGFLGQVEKFPTLLDELRRRVKFGHSTLVQHNDSIRVDDRIDTMGYGDYSAVLENAAT